MRVIDKTILSNSPDQVIELPRDAQVLSTDNQHELICVWYAFDPNDQDVLRLRPFKIVGTGWLPEDLAGFQFVGTVLLSDGNLVVHVFVGMEMAR